MLARDSREEERASLPLIVGRVVWRELPLLLALDCLFVAAALVPGVLLLVGAYPLAPLAAALTVGPAWAGIVCVTDRLVQDEGVRMRDVIAVVGRHARRGIELSAVPAAAAVAALGTLAMLHADTGQSWLLIPLIVDGSVLTLSLLAGFSAFSLATTGGLAGWALVRASLEIAATNPLLTTGTVALLVIGGFAVSWVPGLFVLLPGPFATYLSGYVRATLHDERRSASA